MNGQSEAGSTARAVRFYVLGSSPPSITYAQASCDDAYSREDEECRKEPRWLRECVLAQSFYELENLSHFIRKDPSK